MGIDDGSERLDAMNSSGRVRLAAFSVGLVEITGFAIDLLGLSVMARLLDPGDFGQLSMIAPLIALLAILVDSGQMQLTLRRQRVDQEALTQSFWLNTLMGAIALVLLAISAPLLSMFFDQPLTLPAIAMGLTLILGGPVLQSHTLLRRELRFGRLGVITLCASVAGNLSGCIAAFAGWGIWALVSATVVTSLGTLALTVFLCPWRPGKLTFAALKSRETAVFARFASASQLATFWDRHFDDVMLGRFSTAADLGYYSRAYALLMLPMRKIVYPLHNLALPMLSRNTEDRDAFRHRYLALLRLLAAAAAAVVALIAWQADRIVLLVLGEDWQRVAVLFRALACGAWINACSIGLTWLYASRGRMRAQFRASLLLAAFKSVLVVAGLHWGALGVALALSLADLLRLVPHTAHATRGTEITLTQFLCEICLPLLPAGGAILILELVANQLPPVNPLLELSFTALAFTGLYLAIYVALPGGGVRLASARWLLSQA